MIKGYSCCAILTFALMMTEVPYANAEISSANLQVHENLIAAKAENNYLVKMQGIRNGKQESKSANIWASTQEEAISKAVKTWEQNSFQNIKITEVKQLN